MEMFCSRTTKLRNYISFLFGCGTNKQTLRLMTPGLEFMCASTQMWAPLRRLKFFADVHGEHRPVELVCTPDATSALGCSPWRKNRDHPSQVQTAPLRIPETYVLYNYNVKIYIETTVCFSRAFLKHGSSARVEERRTRRIREKEGCRGEKKMVFALRTDVRLCCILRDAHARGTAMGSDKRLKDFRSAHRTI